MTRDFHDSGLMECQHQDWSSLHYANSFQQKTFLSAAKPAGLWITNITLFSLDTWSLAALDAFKDMLAQVSELARIKYDVS